VGIGAGKLTEIPPPDVSVQCPIRLSAGLFDGRFNISIGRERENFNFKEVRNRTKKLQPLISSLCWRDGRIGYCSAVGGVRVYREGVS
jgi:hypothetical protein